MLPLLKRRPIVVLSLLLLLVTAAAAQSQDSNITELRLFLTEEPGVVRGEIATAGPSTLAARSVAAEDGTVTFRDDGSGADQVQGDGVFSARFEFDTTGEFEALRADLATTIEVLRDPGDNILIRRGLRDIVTAADAIRDAERQWPDVLNTARQEAERSARLLEFQDPLRAAEALGIDIAKTPFQRVPGPGLDRLERGQPRVEHLFDFPIFHRFPPLALPIAIDRDRSLMMTATDVVEDGMRSFDSCTGAGARGGAWSFGHLMRELAHGTGHTPEEFTLHWLSSWQVPDTVNDWPVDPRHHQLQHFIDGWRRLSPQGVLDIEYFPARLLAIVNRPDLADGFGAGGSAGEGRLVFGLILNSENDGCIPLGFTVVFEYEFPADSCMEVKAWQQRWKDLDQFDDTDDYNLALESVTRAFTDHGSNPGQLPNASSLSHLKTNEDVLGSDWQMREFRLGETGLLDLVTVNQTPANELNGLETLGDYLANNEADILADRHEVPARFPDDPDRFLGAVSTTTFEGYFWSAPNVEGLTDQAETRRKFSLATCNGCHGGETGTPFTHIGHDGKRDMGDSAWLSGFLRGKTVTVPMSGGGTRRYEDLTEREIEMSELLSRPCFRLLGLERSLFVH
jgi:hypothetical protein